MKKTTHELLVKRIIQMEARINACKRCSSAHHCFNTPSMGKGDLTPEILLVFQSQGNRRPEMNNYIEIRQMLKKEFDQERIYHTFLVRCQPQACFHIDDTEDMLVRHKAFYKKECQFNEPDCPGIPILPTSKEVVSCLPYLIEEIDILAPNTVILFGKRTAEFVLKAKGVLEEPMIPGFYKYNNRCIFTTVEENLFTREDAKKLTGFIAARQEYLA